MLADSNHLTRRPSEHGISTALVRLAKTYQVICEEMKKTESKYEIAPTPFKLGSERPFGKAHLLWQIFGLEKVEESNDDE